MKIQLADRCTGEDPEKLLESLKKIVEILEQGGHEVYCPVLDPDRPKEKRALFLNTMKKLEEHDAILALIKSNEKSEGMLMEIGYAMGKDKKVIAAIQEGVQTHLSVLADEVIEFRDIDDLYGKLRALKS
ncbi:MAG: nucleoside 2-deoxyribosyltransferase [Nanoarchaeota archaeon]